MSRSYGRSGRSGRSSRSGWGLCWPIATLSGGEVPAEGDVLQGLGQDGDCFSV